MAEILAPIAGNVWQVLVATIESMRLEIPVEVATSGTVQDVLAPRAMRSWTTT